MAQSVRDFHLFYGATPSKLIFGNYKNSWHWKKSHFMMHETTTDDEEQRRRQSSIITCCCCLLLLPLSLLQTRRRQRGRAYIWRGRGRAYIWRIPPQAYKLRKMPTLSPGPRPSPGLTFRLGLIKFETRYYYNCSVVV